MVYVFVDDVMEALLHRTNSHTIRERRQILLSFPSYLHTLILNHSFMQREISLHANLTLLNDLHNDVP
jgi:hypothetical protein